ncbi:uracil-DNA glycosylase [Salinigranum rubrum]|uniref:Uracil-DNA glycosylase n=1 Tax=Salinigranum rubrum TaxID=755307 RepID=A0A2I8VNP8_9EURY|nr:uracil-DNA glycosylase [Salinigranum rubrum]AUV83504.1 uracil-DNA glycosylase [Salinigranum rubrum]
MADSHFPSSRNVLDPDCRRCPALVDSRTEISWGTGPTDADVVVVGEAPGAGDPSADRWQGGNHTGMAYTTRHSGRRIRGLFARLGYDPYYTNAVKCFPEEGGTNREPTAEERSNCRSHLERELQQVDPSVVVTTGKHATTTVLALDGRVVESFLDRVLDPVRLSAYDVSVLPLLHPSYQEVWLSRLGYDLDEYEAAIGEALSSLVSG